jgi:hypothetical protein
LWSTNSFQFSSFGFNVIPELRIRNNLSELYYFQAYIGPSRSLNENLKLNVYYGCKFSKSGSNWLQSNLGYLDLIYAFDPFSNRFRLEGDFTSGTVKFREQLQAKFQGFYLSDELFYNLTKSFVDENRLAAGYAWKVDPAKEISLGYMLRSQKASAGADWATTSAVLANSSIKI